MVLIEPEIPGNTGSAARTCVATNTPLWIVGPTPFQITDARLKRAGLDYWPHLNWKWVSDAEQFLKLSEGRRLVLTSARTGIPYHEFSFKSGDMILLGKETRGLPAEWLDSQKYPVITLPMWGKTRSLNQANAATVFLYEAYRQLGFPPTCSSTP
ncbi:tRNA (cytidine(34)-2'-O)-methyltransferase [bacterium]|nr:tRNA (cytidine(34)-2'-O)-methyltransferase [bacterium]